MADVLRWPFERLVWIVERHLLWPLRERTAGWAPPRRATGAAALGLVAVAAIAVGALALGGDDEPSTQVAAPASVAVAPPPAPAADEPEEPTMQGAPPSFGVGEGVGVAQAPDDEATSSGDEADASEAEDEAVTASEETPEPTEAAATASSSKPVPAGPVAMKTARRFAEAFVFYEIGERPVRAKTVFAETATPQLAEALGERPPRQPASTEVPQARVVNLVPGPRENGAYTVSVSLLRVGLTSELRLEMRKQAGTWVVTDVRG